MPAERIHFELFAVAGSSQKRGRPRWRHQPDHPDQRRPRNSVSVRGAGNAQGADLPYSCNAGVYSICKCKVIEDEVVMDIWPISSTP